MLNLTICFAVILEATFGQELLTQSDGALTYTAEVSTSLTTHESVTMEIFTGRWEVFNDPLLDRRLIPDDPAQREGLRVTLLCSAWFTQVIQGYDVINMKLNNQKLKHYYYEEIRDPDGYITLCYGAIVGPFKVFSCFNMTKAEIDKASDYGTFKWVLENFKTPFILEMVILPIIFLLGTFGR